MSLPVPFPTRLPSPGISYEPGTILPWYAANSKRELKWARQNPPEGFEILQEPKVTLRPNLPRVYPHFYNGSKYPIYVLYVRKV